MFIINIKDENGQQVELKPGGNAEYELSQLIQNYVKQQNLNVFNVETVLRALRSKGVGWFTSEAKVLDAVRDVLGEHNVEEWEAKVLEAVAAGISKAFYKVKSDVKPTR